jgi:hypothetical protein
MGRKADARHLEAVQRISDLFWAAQLHSDATAAVSLATGPSLSLPVRWESKLNGSDVSEKTYTTGP